MLICAGLSPHPPIIIPDIGGDELQKVKSTTAAMREWASSIAEQSPQVLVFISSHGIFLRSQMGYLRTPEICGDFAAFGAPQVSFQVENDLDLARRIAREAEREGVETVGVDLDDWYAHDYGSLDHGITVPLYYLEQAGVEAAVVAFGISMLTRQRLFGFGQALGRVLQRSPRRIALIASGDLSHRLQPGASAGYSPRGREFDQIIRESLEQMDAERVLNIADDLAEGAGECGLRPIIMLMGALDNFEAEPKIYSYEGPFGVGYLVAGFRIGNYKGNETKESAHTQLARRSLEYYLRTGETMPVPQPVPEGMEERAGVFVSLKKSGRLRGCIGTFAPYHKNIASEIIHNAVAAGVEDPRFWPVELSELPEIDFSVDVLTSPAPVSSRDELDAKRYGVIVKSGRKTGLLLPDLEGVDSADQQISIACQKAGISPGEQIELFRFEVIRYR